MHVYKLAQFEHSPHVFSGDKMGACWRAWRHCSVCLVFNHLTQNI